MSAVPLQALILSCTLKKSPAPSNAEALADVLAGTLRSGGAQVETIRVVDHHVLPGVSSDEGPGDDWPAIRERIVAADILVIATPTWIGQPSSVCQQVLERMDAMLSETKDDGRPIAYDKVAGVVVVGNEDGAHHIIAIVAQAMMDFGFTIPAQAWTYWHRGPGAGPDYLDDPFGHEWSRTTGVTAAQNLLSVARALKANPLPAPVSSS